MAVTAKAEDSVFQPPGCSMQLLNGIWVPQTVRAPIDLDAIESDWLQEWDSVQKRITEAIQRDEQKTRDANSSIALRVSERRRRIVATIPPTTMRVVSLG